MEEESLSSPFFSAAEKKPKKGEEKERRGEGGGRSLLFLISMTCPDNIMYSSPGVGGRGRKGNAFFTFHFLAIFREDREKGGKRGGWETEAMCTHLA